MTKKNEITMAVDIAIAAGLAVDGSAVLGAFVCTTFNIVLKV